MPIATRLCSIEALNSMPVTVAAVPNAPSATPAVRMPRPTGLTDITECAQILGLDLIVPVPASDLAIGVMAAMLPEGGIVLAPQPDLPTLRNDRNVLAHELAPASPQEAIAFAEHIAFAPLIPVA